jgi:hypothetical protein
MNIESAGRNSKDNMTSESLKNSIGFQGDIATLKGEQQAAK